MLCRQSAFIMFQSRCFIDLQLTSELLVVIIILYVVYSEYILLALLEVHHCWSVISVSLLASLLRLIREEWYGTCQWMSVSMFTAWLQYRCLWVWTTWSLLMYMKLVCVCVWQYGMQITTSFHRLSDGRDEIFYYYVYATTMWLVLLCCDHVPISRDNTSSRGTGWVDHVVFKKHSDDGCEWPDRKSVV